MIEALSSTLAEHGSVGLKTVLLRGRLDASVYNLEALAWHDHISSGSSRPFLDSLFVSSATYPGRFKRKYVEKSVGVPFLLPS